MSRRSTPIRNSVMLKKDYRFTIRNVRQLKTYRSAPMYMHNVPWQVKLTKSGDNITIELCCRYIATTLTPNWSCAARAEITLLSFATKAELYEKRQDIVAVFTSELSSIARNQELIKWNDLFDSKRQHISNNSIVIGVNIQADKLRNARQSRLIEIERTYGHATFRFKLTKVKELIAMSSPKFTFWGVNCELTITKRYALTKKELDEDKAGYLGIWLFSEIVDISNFTIQVTFRLLSYKLDGKHHDKLGDRGSIDRLNFSSRLIPLHQLYESPHEYLRDDSLTLEVDIKSEPIRDNATPSDGSGSAKKITMDCPVCFNNMYDRPCSSTLCGHIFCKTCVIGILRNRAVCPLCSNRVRRRDLRDVFLPPIRESE